MLTRQILAFGGREVNPVADAFIRTPAAWAFKGVFVVVIAFVGAHVMRSQWVIKVFYAVLAIYAIAVIINAAQLIVVMGTIL